MSFSPSQLGTLAFLERLGGSISLVSVLVIFATYGLIARVRNPRNTFIVFMQSDAWWSLGMSFNTFLVVSGRTNPNTFSKWKYSMVCFGGPFITGFTLFFISDPNRGPVYGATAIWCWIREDWASIRVFTSYIFVWICIIGSLILNTIVGYRIFHARNQIRHFTDSQSQRSAIDNQGLEHPIIVTEVSIAHSPASDIAKPMPIRTNSAWQSLETSQNEQSNRYSSTITSHKNNVTKTQGIVNTTRRVISSFRLQDPIKRAYLRITFMFTLSVLVTWVPASINRIRGMQGIGVPYPYQVVMVAIMPLQGLWNAIIFFVTSQDVLREVAREKWGLWVLESTTIDGEVVERATVRVDNVGQDPDRTDSGSDVELRRISRQPIKGN
ncbi:hypothetical protein ACJZ2D_016366 [Fusarium nematophilum]